MFVCLFVAVLCPAWVHAAVRAIPPLEVLPAGSPDNLRPSPHPRGLESLLASGDGQQQQQQQLGKVFDNNDDDHHHLHHQQERENERRRSFEGGVT